MRPYHGFSHILLLLRHLILPVFYVTATLWDTLLLTQKTNKQTNKNKNKTMKSAEGLIGKSCRVPWNPRAPTGWPMLKIKPLNHITKTPYPC